MPTILLVKGFRFFFFSGDGKEPVHIHVKKGDGDGKIWLFPEIRVAYFMGFSAQDEKQILDIVIENRETIIKKWNEYFSQ